MIYTNCDYTGWDLSGCTDMSGRTIEGMCLSQCTPRAVLPADLTGTTFVDCNLDNVVVPEGNTLIRTANRRYLAQEDGNDWEVDENDNPIKILGT